MPFILKLRSRALKRSHWGSVLATCLIVLSCTACVKKRLYKTEFTNRQLSEAREKVLHNELTDRKTEAAKMILQIGELNKTVGRQEVEIAELRNRIVQMSNTATKTTSTLLDEKNALEKILAEKTATLEQKTAELNRLLAIENARLSKLSELEKVLQQTIGTQAGVNIQLNDRHVVVIIQDQTLFEPTGMSLAPTGKAVLDSLARVMTQRPELPAQIITYTDNQLPKNNKQVTDTWDWSLRRATTIVRTLSTDYGVNPNQLTPTGRGEFYPVASNETPEGRAQNRRTEIVFF